MADLINREFQNGEVLDAQHLNELVSGINTNNDEITAVKNNFTSLRNEISGANYATQGYVRDYFVPLNKANVANGFAQLDSTGKIEATQLPSYVDDIIEGYYDYEGSKNFYQSSEFDAESKLDPEAGKIYVDLLTNKSYRWGGSQYVEISSSLALGETEGTAYQGSRGKALEDAFEWLTEMLDEVDTVITSEADLDSRANTNAFITGMTNAIANGTPVSNLALNSAYARRADELNHKLWVNMTGDVTGSTKEFTTTGGLTTNIELTLTDSGVTAGEYTKVTVDSKGRVTQGAKPTEIADLGVTNVYTKSEVDALVDELDVDYTETDPTVPDWAKEETKPTLSYWAEDDTAKYVTAAEKASWNAKSEFSGKYTDLTDTPVIPVVPTNVGAFRNDAGYITASSLTENSLKLETDLYTYVPIGNAQKASNETIGIGSTISATNRGKLGSAGDSLKQVFNKVFGEEKDVEPTITTTDVKLTASATSVSTPGSEYGSEVKEENVTITFTLANAGTASYGYRCGDVLTSGSRTFYYPITKQNGADIVLTLPANKTATIANGGGTLVSASPSSGSTTNNILYCNFNDSQQVKITINLPADSVSDTAKTRYGAITAAVSLGKAQKENQLSTGTEITAFLTFLKADAANQSKLSISIEDKTTSAYTIAAGSFYAYSKLDTSATAPTSGATKQSKSDADNTYSYDVGQYLWLYSRTSGKKIQTYVAGSWADVATFGGSTMTLTLSSGGSATYYAYRTDMFTAKGSARYRLV